MLKSKRDPTVKAKPLTDYTLQAEERLLKDVQFQLMSKAKTKKWEREFGLYRDERGIFRCEGRLKNAELTTTQKHPAILDAEHYVTSLLVRDSHEREGIAYKPPDPLALPVFRITKDHPFTYTGVDFAGPLYVKQVKAVAMEKVYMVIYTCAVSRAVHLDVVSDMTAEAFIRSFRRFTARRGIPREVKSNNGKTFKAASKQLPALFEIPEVKKYLSDQRIRWTFNLEKAAWWGGFFERLIKSVKRCLYKILKNASVTNEELYTVLTEIEATLNSRPLTYVSTEDLDEPITPSHLINGTRINSLPDAVKPGEESRIEEITNNKVARRVSYLKTLKEHFWLRWKNEYLLELRNAHRQKTTRHKGNCIKVGDVVVIHEENVRRVKWKLGRIEKLIEGKDGAIRGAVVRKLTDKGGKCTEIIPG
ncbi:E3 ubiquitin- ligase DZIP3 [Paramuricea clavata]|uniref:E3 ubiquitin- ligase DZIP3 n=1 Tax=Paramuricea clavata TaxID=317549 RepID=A0A7D9K2W7_PARCT|nr:E3 ubiquitin- ligase DZIP3 [Paramuricea clavata]